MRELLEVLNRYRERLLALDGVVGCGLGHKRRKGENTGQRAVVILVERKRPIREIPAGHAAPARLDGVPTDVMQTGRMRLLSEIRTSRARPAPPGVSIGHVDVTAGTFGAVAKDAVSGAPMILSNNHVLANSSDGRDVRAQIGDPILQPGFFDGGRVPGDVIGRLARFAPIRRLSGGRVEINRADAALAEPLQNDLVSPEVLGLGLITGIADAEADMKLRKSGRTTGVTSGEVRALAVTLDVAGEKQADNGSG